MGVMRIFLGVLFALTLVGASNAQLNTTCSTPRRIQMSPTASEGLVMCEPATLKWVSASGSMSGGTSTVGLNDTFSEFKVEINGVRVMTATSTGLGIGTATPAFSLDMTGRARGAGFIVNSDERLKHDFSPLSPQIAHDYVMGINAGTFAWNKDKTKDFGYIAQNIEKSTGDIGNLLVTTDDNGMKAVSYDKMAGLTIQAYKHQNEQIEALKKQNEEQGVLLRLSFMISVLLSVGLFGMAMRRNSSV